MIYKAVIVALLWKTVTALPAETTGSDADILGSSYAPRSSWCPSESLVRPADCLSTKETDYRESRKAVADIALRDWLLKTNLGFQTNNLPTLALTTSGGGYRSFLIGAGVIQGLDARDSDCSTSGLYQAITYQAGLSGGGWLLSSLAGNNYPTVSSLKENLWKQAFQDSLLDLENFLAFGPYLEIVTDILAKEIAGYHTTLTDAWGRLLSYQFLQGHNGGVSTTLSSITGLSSFTSFDAPFPVIVALGTKVWDGECLPGPTGTIYEFTPYEFGSWDPDVSAFMQTKYLSTSMKAGKPSSWWYGCTTNYDNLGFVLGTTSSIFNEACLNAPPAQNSTTDIVVALAGLLSEAHEVGTEDEYALYTNPFYKYYSSTAKYNPSNAVQEQKQLSLVDGGEAEQNNPIMPFLQPARGIDVILVNENSADTKLHYPNGSEILTTYIQSLNLGLTRMPFIPSVQTFLDQGLDKKSTFFGCGDKDKVTIVWLPNAEYSFASGISTFKMQYSKDETDQMIENGVGVVTQGGKEGWATCLGCALMMKTGSVLPTECEACFDEYCFKQ